MAVPEIALKSLSEELGYFENITKAKQCRNDDIHKFLEKLELTFMIKYSDASEYRQKYDLLETELDVRVIDASAVSGNVKKLEQFIELMNNSKSDQEEIERIIDEYKKRRIEIAGSITSKSDDKDLYEKIHDKYKSVATEHDELQKCIETLGENDKTNEALENLCEEYLASIEILTNILKEMQDFYENGQ